MAQPNRAVAADDLSVRARVRGTNARPGICYYSGANHDLPVRNRRFGAPSPQARLRSVNFTAKHVSALPSHDGGSDDACQRYWLTNGFELIRAPLLSCESKKGGSLYSGDNDKFSSFVVFTTEKFRLVLLATANAVKLFF